MTEDMDWFGALPAQESAENEIAFESFMGKYPTNVVEAARELDLINHKIISWEEGEDGYPDAFPLGLLAVDEPSNVDVDQLSFGSGCYGTDGAILEGSSGDDEEVAERVAAAQYYKDLVVTPLAERNDLDSQGLNQLGQLRRDLLEAFKQNFLESLE